MGNDPFFKGSWRLQVDVSLNPPDSKREQGDSTLAKNRSMPTKPEWTRIVPDATYTILRVPFSGWFKGKPKAQASFLGSPIYAAWQCNCKTFGEQQNCCNAIDPPVARRAEMDEIPLKMGFP